MALIGMFGKRQVMSVFFIVFVCISILSDSDLQNFEGTVENLATVAVSTSSEEHISTKKGIQYTVVKVVDGDTLDVLINGVVEGLRLIGINTPETVDPRKPVECFGVEASNRAKSILSGQKIFLEADETQDSRDKYNRLLRYVFLEDGTNFNLRMIKEGYAYEYTYGVPYKYQTEFKSAQKYAEANKLGLWGDQCK